MRYRRSLVAMISTLFVLAVALGAPEEPTDYAASAGLEINARLQILTPVVECGEEVRLAAIWTNPTDSDVALDVPSLHLSEFDYCWHTITLHAATGPVSKAHYVLLIDQLSRRCNHIHWSTSFPVHKIQKTDRVRYEIPLSVLCDTSTLPNGSHTFEYTIEYGYKHSGSKAGGFNRRIDRGSISFLIDRK
jgi:hypothetical protein